MINLKDIKVWKIGSRWSDKGVPDSSVLDIFKKYNVAFVGGAKDSISEVKTGDLLAVGDGNTIVSVGIITEMPKPITELIFDEEDQNSGRFDLEEWVTAFRVVLFDLDRKDMFDYPSRQKFHKAKGEYEQRIKDIVIDNFMYFSEPLQQDKPNPFGIKQLKISNYQGIKSIHLIDIPVDTQMIFLTGENGFGKTSVLQAIVIGLFGNKDGDKLLDKTEKIKSIVEISAEGKSEIYYSLSKSAKKFNTYAAYGPARLNKNARANISLKTQNLFNTYSDLLDIEDKMIMWEGAENQKIYFKAAKKILLKLMSPYVKDLKVERIGSKTDVVYKETDSLEYKPFDELASGFKSIIAITGDMLIRLSEEQPFISNFEEFVGIVIIDEFDLHLHPKMQREVVNRLSETFKKIQFIVSTHSPIPFLGAPKNSVFIKVERDEKNGITAEKIDIDISKLTPNSILTSPVFGFDDINSIETDIDDDDVETADRYSNIVAEKRLKEKLDILKQNDEDFFNSLEVE